MKWNIGDIVMVCFYDKATDTKPFRILYGFIAKKSSNGKSHVGQYFDRKWGTFEISGNGNDWKGRPVFTKIAGEQ